MFDNNYNSNVKLITIITQIFAKKTYFMIIIQNIQTYLDNLIGLILQQNA